MKVLDAHSWRYHSSSRGSAHSEVRLPMMYSPNSFPFCIFGVVYMLDLRFMQTVNLLLENLKQSSQIPPRSGRPRLKSVYSLRIVNELQLCTSSNDSGIDPKIIYIQGESLGTWITAPNAIPTKASIRQSYHLSHLPTHPSCARSIVLKTYNLKLSRATKSLPGAALLSRRSFSPKWAKYYCPLFNYKTILLVRAPKLSGMGFYTFWKILGDFLVSHSSFKCRCHQAG